MGTAEKSEDAPSRFRTAAAEGGVLDLRSLDPSKDEPEHGESWGAERTIPAELVVELASETPTEGPPLKTLRVRGAKIAGSLQFEGLTLSRSILLQDCFLEGPVTLREADLVSMRLPGCFLTGGLDARNVNVRGSLELNAGFQSNGLVNLTRADIGGELVCAGGRFLNPGETALTLKTASVSGSVICMEGFVANGEVRMNDARIGGQLICTGGKFTNPKGIALAADRASIAGSVHYRKGFVAEGVVRMLGATISGPLVCTGGQFTNPKSIALSVDRATISGGVYCETGFIASGEVRLPGTRIGNQLTCEGGRFLNPGGNALMMESAIVNGSVGFHNEFVAEGMVRIRFASIDGSLSCKGGRFSNPEGTALLMDGTSIEGSLFFGEGFVSEGAIKLNESRVSGQLVHTGKSLTEGLAWDLESLRVTKDLYFTPSDPLQGWIDFTNAQVGHLHDNDNAWTGGYELCGLQYETLQGTPETTLKKEHWWERDPALEKRLAWLANNRSGYQPQVYDQLGQVYRKAGHDSHRRRVLIEKQRRRRQHATAPAKLWSYAVDALVGFGYRTWLALIPFAALLIFGILFFDAHQHDVVPKNAELQSPDFNSVTYTLDLLVPVVTLGLRENYVARHGAETVATILVVAGWVLTTAIIAALTGLVRRTD